MILPQVAGLTDTQIEHFTAHGFLWLNHVFDKTIADEGRALLMLFLFSGVGALDAPIRFRKDSHQEVARLLQPAGDKELLFTELAKNLFATAHRPRVLATGAAGTVYLCHPFLVHAVQPHRGTAPRFMAQPPLELKRSLSLDQEEKSCFPLAVAIH